MPMLTYPAIIVIQDTIKHYQASSSPEWSLKDSLDHVLTVYDIGIYLPEEEYAELLTLSKKFLTWSIS